MLALDQLDLHLRLETSRLLKVFRQTNGGVSVIV